MTSIEALQAIDVLVEEKPSYDELLCLYNELRAAQAETPTPTVNRRALAQVIGEMIDYLDFVEADLEKSIGLSRAAERRRILAALEEPRGNDPVERVASLIRQWDAIKQYTRDEVVSAFE
jgi:hypothetical protein